MQHAKRRRWVIVLSLVMAATLGIVISLLVLGSPERDFTITAYSDVVRFQAEGVATLQVRIFDLSGKVVWDSSIVSGDTIDWNRNNDFGERLAYGAYIYSTQGWNASGDLIFQKNGKLALMPGDKVQLQAAPAVTTPGPSANTLEDPALTVQPKALGDTYICSKLGIGTSSTPHPFQVTGSAGTTYIDFSGIRIGFSRPGANYIWAMSPGGYYCFGVNGTTPGLADASLILRVNGNVEMPVGNVGIGAKDPTAKLEVESSTGQDLIAAYNSSNRVFVVKSTGEVRADGAYYSGAGDCNTGGFNAGGADVAERINVSEWVEAGCVVEIDADHPGFFRKSSLPYSTKVAGIISTSPGVILGNSFDASADKWEDNRPVLAVTGRVPCKVSAENGPIQIGDLLVASSTFGVAMKGNPEESMGAVVGKAMEPLKEGEGTIVVQVMLR